MYDVQTRVLTVGIVNNQFYVCRNSGIGRRRRGENLLEEHFIRLEGKLSPPNPLTPFKRHYRPQSLLWETVNMNYTP